jgi:hypothetical protein
MKEFILLLVLVGIILHQQYPSFRSVPTGKIRPLSIKTEQALMNDTHGAMKTTDTTIQQTSGTLRAKRVKSSVYSGETKTDELSGSVLHHRGKIRHVWSNKVDLDHARFGSGRIGHTVPARLAGPARFRTTPSGYQPAPNRF